MHKQLKRLSIGIVGALVIFGAYTASAWTLDSNQRGFSDSILWHQGFVVGPTPQLEFKGWACLNPRFNTAVPANRQLFQVYQGTTLLAIDFAAATIRQDAVNAGACANSDNGFTLGVHGADAGKPNIFTIVWLGGFAPITLEGPTAATIIN